jgi:opacity protein-like surface antigen
MGKIRTQLLATAAVVALSSAAHAADMGMPLKAPPPPPPPVQDWSGVYVGVEGGYGWGQQNVNSTVPYLLTPGDTDCHKINDSFPACKFPGSGLGGLNSNFAELNPIDIALSNHNQSGGVVGAFVGVQKQYGSWVLGAEASADYANITSSQNTTLTSTVIHADGNEGTFTQATNNATFSSRIDEIGAVNLKLGWAASPNWMIYGTGGLAFAHETNSLSVSQSLYHLDCDTTDSTGGIFACDARTGVVNHPADDNTDGLTRFASNSFSGSGGTTMFGWTAGAGIDYKWQLDAGSAVIFGIDYKHYGFGNHTFVMATSDGGSFSFNASQNIDVVKARLSYLFSIH